MDQAPNRPAETSANANSSGAVSPAMSAWDDYYRAASRRRRQAGGGRQLAVEKRRRRWRERIGLGLSALVVGAMTAVFYFVLR
jgi:predicted membrane-bound mannosyltransferase